MRHAGNHAQHADDGGGQDEHLRAGDQLPDQLLADVVFAGNAAHHHTRRGGDHQRRDLRHQAVADGQQGVVLGRSRQIQIVLQHADDQTADDVDEHDDDAGDRIAAHELATHRPSRRRNRLPARSRRGVCAPRLRRSGRHSDRHRSPSACPASHPG